MSALARVLLAVTLSAVACDSSRAGQTSVTAAPSASVGPAPTRPPAALERGLRSAVVRDAAEISRAFARLKAAEQARDRASAWRAYLELRTAWRKLLPFADLMTYAALLEPPRGEPDEVPTDVGLRAIADALRDEPPDFARLGRVLERTAPAALRAERDAQVINLDVRGVAVATSRGVFEWGRMLDGSLGESAEEARLDAWVGAHALLDHAERLRAQSNDAPGRQRLGAAMRRFRSWLESQKSAEGAAPIGDKLAGLRASGELGAALRGLLAVQGGSAPAPYPPRRRTTAQESDEPVSIATFPRLPGPAVDPARAALGRALFGDKRLSANGRMSCATCHRAEHALSAGAKRPRAADGSALARDVPSLWNVAYEPMFFWDGRASTLDRQVEIAVERDMGGRWPEIVERLSKDETFVRKMKAVFPEGVTAKSVRAVLAEHERTLIADDTPFDRAVRGEGALTELQRRGFDLFFGPARCSRCHRLPLTTGAEPPRFSRAELSAIGVPTAPDHRRLDPDRGRGAISGRALEEHAFKVPSLRNLKRTAPYFHNGAFRTLEQVVDFYAKGSGQGLGIAPATFDPDARAFELSADDRRALLAFLRDALSDPGATRGP